MSKEICKSRLLSLTLAFSMAAGVMQTGGITVYAGNTQESVIVSATAASGEKFIVNENELTVSSDEAEKFGYMDSLAEGVSALDVLVKMHETAFGDAFTAETAADYLNLPGGWISCAFGERTTGVGYTVNRDYASDLYCEMKNGDAFELFFYQDLTYWSDTYVHLNDITATAGEETVINASSYGTPLAGVQLAAVDGLVITPIYGAIADENGDIRVTFDKAGTYYVTLTGSFRNTATDWTTGEQVQLDSPVVPSVTRVTVELPDDPILPDDIYAATARTVSGMELAYGSEWAVMGLARAGIRVPDTYYKSVMDAVKNGTPEKVTDYERAAIALTAIGKKADQSILEKLSSASYVKNGGVMSLIYALTAFDTADYEIPQNSDSEDQNTRDIMIEGILEHQNEDGGFSLSASKASTVDITAMAAAALAKYADQTGIRDSIEKALAFIDSNIDTDDANSPDKCSTLAQVIVAYTELGKNPKLYVDKMLDYYDGSGQFTYAGNANTIATVQAYYALVAYYRWANGENSLYDMSDAFYNIEDYDGISCIIYAPFAGKAAVIGADYTDGAMTKLNAEDIEFARGENTIEMQNSDKLMVWDSLSGMQQLCETYVR